MKTARQFKDCVKQVVLPRMTQNIQYIASASHFAPSAQSVSYLLESNTFRGSWQKPLNTRWFKFERD